MNDKASAATFRAGWIYVLQHKNFPASLKIGFTERSVEERIAEIESATGVIPGFSIEYAALVENPREIEGKIHRSLDQYRTNKNKEFFEISVIYAVESIKSIIDDSCINILHEIDKMEINKKIEKNKLEERWYDGLIQGLKENEREFSIEIKNIVDDECNEIFAKYMRNKKSIQSKKEPLVEEIGFYSTISGIILMFYSNNVEFLLISAAGVGYQWFNNKRITKENNLLEQSNKRFLDQQKEIIEKLFAKFDLFKNYCPQQYLLLDNNDYDARNIELYKYLEKSDDEYRKNARKITSKIVYLKGKKNIINFYKENYGVDLYYNDMFKDMLEVEFLADTEMYEICKKYKDDNLVSRKIQSLTELETQLLSEMLELTDFKLEVDLQLKAV